MLEGEFKSVFENRLDESFISSTAYETKYRSEPNKMLVVSDGDIIRNEVDSKQANGQTMYRPIPLQYDIYGVLTPNKTPKYQYGNRDFVLNCIDYMMDDFSLIDVRAKTITIRSLDKVKIAENKEWWKFLNIAFPLLFIIALAIFQIYRRKRKYARN